MTELISVRPGSIGGSATWVAMPAISITFSKWGGISRPGSEAESTSMGLKKTPITRRLTRQN